MTNVASQVRSVEKRSLKIFDRPISVLGFGGSLYTSIEHTDAAHDFQKAMECAFDAGINHFDTAQSYHNGQGERVFGKCISGWKRERCILATKMHLLESKDEAIAGVEASLKNLATDYLDLFYIHWPSGDIDPRPMMEGLEECRRRGVLKRIGVSNFSVEQMEMLQEAGTVDVVQLCYNLLWRKHEKDLIPYCLEREIGLFSYSSLAQGILTGKYSKDYRPRNNDARQQSIFFRADVWPVVHEAVSKMQRLACDNETTLVELALRWIVRQKSILSVIIGSRSPEQVLSNIQAASGSLSDDLLHELTHISTDLQKKIPDTGNIFQYNPE